jgi:hypothetical protein
MRANRATPVVLMVVSVLAACAACASSLQYVRQHNAAHDIYRTNDLAAAEAQAQRMNLNPERFYRMAGYLAWLSVGLATISVAFAVKSKSASLLVGASFSVLIAVASLLWTLVRV